MTWRYFILQANYELQLFYWQETASKLSTELDSAVHKA